MKSSVVYCLTKSRSAGFDKIVCSTAKDDASDAGSAVEGFCAKAAPASEVNATVAAALRRVPAMVGMLRSFVDCLFVL